MANNDQSRRGFLEIVLGGAAVAAVGAVFYPMVKYIVPPEAGEAKLSQLKLAFDRAAIASEAKKAKYFKYGRELGIIFIDNKNELKALSATCTHLDCTVQFVPDQEIIWCSCHNGKYSIEGRNISGPPPKPLFEFAVKEVNGAIFVSKENG